MGKRRSEKAGLPPGTPVFIGEASRATSMSLINYSGSAFERKDGASLGDCIAAKDSPGVAWVDVDGLSDGAALQKLCEGFGIHPLVIEDILDTNQRPKVEDYGDYIYIVAKMLRYSADGISTEQVSILLGRDFVISFQEGKGDVFDPVRERLRKPEGRLRKGGPDFLAYALIDSIVDSYFGILERFGEDLEGMEDEMITNPVPKTLKSLHRMKHDAITVRKAVWPLRDVVSVLERSDTGKGSLIRKETIFYLRDVYDHTNQIIDNVETFRDIMSGMLDVYLSSVSNRLNEVMKVLTVISTIFIPLTFIVGIYGMNFKDMPELGLPWGYEAVWAVMLLIAATMILYFRRRKWL